MWRRREMCEKQYWMLNAVTLHAGGTHMQGPQLHPADLESSTLHSCPTTGQADHLLSVKPSRCDCLAVFCCFCVHLLYID